MTMYIKIAGTDYGPHGNNVILGGSLSITKGSGSKNGTATIKLRSPYAFAYDIHDRQEVQMYDLVGGTANGLFGGFVVAVDSKGIKGAPYRDVTVKCVDYNVLWDAIVARLASPITLSTATLPTQITALVQAFQRGGNPSVSKTIDSTTYITNLTGATTLPALVIPGGSTFRQGMRALMANVQANTPALRPRWSITLESDGVGGVQAAVILVDGASTPTPVAAFVYGTPGGGQRSIYNFERTLDSSMPLVNSRQARWHTAFGEQYVSYSNPTSGATYNNPYRNDGLTGNTGYWGDLPLDDKDSANSTDATNKLTRLVQAVEYPRESTILTFDKLPAETLFVRVGQAVTVTWPPDQLVTAPYIVTGVAIAFPVSSKESYERVTLTLGLPKLELGEDGTDGLAGAPHEITWAPIPPSALALDTSYGTSGWTWQGHDTATGGFVWVAPAGRQPLAYRLQLHEVTPGSHDLFVQVPGDTVKAQCHNMLIGGVYTPSVTSIFEGAESTPDTIGNITVPAPAPSPPTALAVDTAWQWGILGYLYDGLGHAQVRLTFTPPSPLPAWYIFQGYLGTSLVFEMRWPNNATGVISPPLNVGDTYTYKVWSEDYYGTRSATAASLGPLIVPASPTAQLTNPGFEFVGAGVASSIRGWTITTASGGTALLQGVSVHSGASALRVTTTGTGGSTAQAQSDLVVVKGATYALKVWARKSGLAAMNLKWTYTWYATDGTTSLGTSTGTMGALPSAFALYSATATAAAGAAYYRLTLEPSGLSMDVFVDDVSSDPQSIANDIAAGAVTAGALALGAVLPGDTNNGVPYLENGSLEIPNTAGTMAAGWDYNNSGTVTYSVVSGIDGSCSVTLGGGVGTHRFQGPEVSWAINKLVGIDLSFWYNLSTLTGTAVTFGLACYDRTGAYITDTPCVMPGGGSFTYVAAGNTLIRGFKSQSTFPGGTTYVAPYVQLVVSSGTGTIAVDNFRMDEAGATIFPTRVQGSGATGTGDTGAYVDLVTTVDVISASGVKLGSTGSSPILKVLTATATLNFPSTAANASSTLTITLTGAAVGDCVLLGVPDSATLGNSAYSAWVSSTNTVKVQFLNNSAGALDPASATFRVGVIQF